MTDIKWKYDARTRSVSITTDEGEVTLDARLLTPAALQELASESSSAEDLVERIQRITPAFEQA